MVEATGADPCDTMSRQEIRAHLAAIAENHIAAAPTYKNIKSDPAKEANVWQGVESGIALTVCFMKAEGLNVADFQNFVGPDVFPANMTILDPILTCRKMEDQPSGDGHYFTYQHIKTPIITSNRCVFNTVYDIE